MSDAQRINHVTRPNPFTISVDGRPVLAHRGETLVTVLFASGVNAFRRSVTGEPRGPVCNMASCFECLVTVNSTSPVLACMTAAAPGMTVTTMGDLP